MGDSISTRVSRVLAGGVNRLIDAIESIAPETVLEQTIREIEGATEEVRSELGRQIAGKHLATRRLFEANKRHDELGEQLQAAVKQKRDDLAELAIAHQLDIEAQIPVIEQTIHEFGEKEKQLEGYLRALHGRVREMRDELVSYRKERDAAAISSTTASGDTETSDVSVRVRRAEAAFERMLEHLTGVPTGSTGSDLASAAKRQELERLTRMNRIQERLAMTKAQLREE